MAAKVADRAIVVAACRCTAAPAATEGPGTSASMGGVRAEHGPPAAARRADAQPRR